MKKLVLLAVVMVLGLGFMVGGAHATHWGGGGYHWARPSNPFTLKLGDNVSGVWDTFLDTASVDWSASSVLETVVVPGGTTPRKCRPTAGRVEICNATYGKTQWLGIAQVWVSGSHITQGTVRVNDTYFNTATYNTPAWRHLVMCQEVGHTLGLPHQDEDFYNPDLGTCMDYTSNPVNNQHPNEHDYDTLELIYAHLDTTTTVGQTTSPAVADVVLDAPHQWGNLVKSSRDGQIEIYELEVSHGHKVVTFVIWAR